MGLFDFFKKAPQPSVSLPQLCYDIAYFILPHYAYEGFEKLEKMARESPSAVGPFFYVMACQMREVEPDKEVAQRFQWHRGTLGSAVEYLLLAYPPPPPVDMSEVSMEALMNATPPLVLAPHFSAVVRNGAGQKSYYILGQSPLNGGTTLRMVTSDGTNCNLGPGPAPILADFLAAVEAS